MYVVILLMQCTYWPIPTSYSWQIIFPKMEVREDLFSRWFCWCSCATAPIGWQAAMETLLQVAENGGPSMFARIDVMRA